MQWSDLVTALGALLLYPITNSASQNPSTNTDFNNFLPRITEGAEQRIRRELDFINTRTANSATVLSTASRQNTLPATIVVLESAYAITPAGSTPAQGTRNFLTPVSLDFLNFIWPTESVGQQTPEYIAQLNDTTVIVAPTPDQAYTLECVGRFIPTPISASNVSTYVSINYPDLLLDACMVIASGFQRDFGSQSDDPKMAMSWETLYGLAKTSAMEEEARRKSQAPNWSPYQQTPQSKPRP